jgi:transcriptional regulator with XRE-family HTH domain
MRTIEDLRKAKGWTQMDLAVHAGVSIAAVSNWETGRNQPRVAELRKVAQALGVSSDTIALVERESGIKILAVAGV